VGKPNKKEQRSDATRVLLIETAEALFAKNGIGAVSLRQIGTQAGSSNVNAVGYHFGNKEGLIKAIYLYRLPEVERSRRTLYERAIEEGNADDFRTLLNALWQPLYDLRSADNSHSFARFLASISRAGFAWTRHALSPLYPATMEIVRRLDELTGLRERDLREFRLQVRFNLLASALEQIDMQFINDEEKAMRCFQEVLDLATAAFTART
jgi:TetR/AcrR family transcriptional regulator, regulator of cefoperazone and chloramphenicol sensitivity